MTSRLAVALAFTASVGVGLAGYGVGHRAGRGEACFDVATQVRDAHDRSLSSYLASRPGATTDYTFWGSDCTISIGFPENGVMRGGRWRYVLHDAKLYADDEAAMELFEAGGRWRP